MYFPLKSIHNRRFKINEMHYFCYLLKQNRSCDNGATAAVYCIDYP